MTETVTRNPNPIAAMLGVRPARWPGRARIFANNKLVAYLVPKHDERGTWEAAYGPYNRGVGNPDFSATWAVRPRLREEFFDRFDVPEGATIRADYEREPRPAVAD